MPRPRLFDVDEALDKAKDLFWAQGYDATSMEDLLQGMGINRGSFYNAFKSKRAVMLASLRRYDSQNRAILLRSLSAGKTPKEAILQVFRAMVDGSRGPQAQHGCFLVNSAIDIAPKDAVAARIVRDGLRDVEIFFSNLAHLAKHQGELPVGSDPDELGRALMNQLVGLMVLVRAGTPKEVLESVVRQVETLLR